MYGASNNVDNVRLQLDWNQLLGTGDDEPPPMLVVKPPSSDSLSKRRNASVVDGGSDRRSDNLKQYNDRDLMDMLQKKKSTLACTGPRLPDKGEKLRALIKDYEEELDRRKKRRVDNEEVDESEKPRPAAYSNSSKGMSNGLRKENTPSQAQPPSSFASLFCDKIQDSDCPKAFSKEFSFLNHCDNHKLRHNEDLSQKKRYSDQSSFRKLPFKFPGNISRREIPIDDRKCRAASGLSPQNFGKKNSGCFPKLRAAFRAIQSDDSRSRKGQPIVLDDEDDLHLLDETDQDKLAECLKDAKIYYPSSDDAESIEICYLDLNCLAPRRYLTSTIMNFYIRYLQEQASLTTRSTSDFHFFNTYFYEKIKEAVSYKQSDRETFFVKFRKWWKGVNIFQKAYVLIPIHEDHHWSLVIICVPDKEDESGPIILHLDSLGLHSSRTVFDNVKRYLIEEWKYLDRESGLSDIPIDAVIWRNLDWRIEDKIITVPQQENDYDCGLFVLYFIKRFIEEAPKRLKKKDLAMFGKQWFKPEEASHLRVKIRSLLEEEFQNPSKQNPLSGECVVTIND